jgi:hypothetical protein
MHRDALIYQPLSRMTEFRHFADGFRSPATGGRRNRITCR